MGTDDYDGHWNMMDGGSGSGWWMVLVMLLVVLAVGIGLAYVARLALRPHPVHGVPGTQVPAPGHRDEEHAVGILRERLARGEIEESDYESRLRALQQR